MDAAKYAGTNYYYGTYEEMCNAMNNFADFGFAPDASHRIQEKDKIYAAFEGGEVLDSYFWFICEGTHSN